MEEKILIIDSHPVYTYKIQDFLHGLTFKNILIAKTGKEGIKTAIVEKPRVIILSAILADMQGEEVCWQVKEVAKLKTKIIVLAGLFTEEHDIQKLRKYGANKVLMKKEKDLDLLQAAIEECFYGEAKRKYSLT